MFVRYACISGLVLLSALPGNAQDLHFNTTAPAWVDGARSNRYAQIGNPAVDVNVSVASTGGSQTFTLGTPKGVSTGLQLAVNFATTGDTKVVTVTFAEGVQGLSFSLLGIDKGANSQDKVTISGSIGRRSSAPSLNPSAYVTVSGNTLTGTADDPGSAASGVAFGGYVDKVTITFGCGPNSPANPTAQGITIGHLSWSGPLPVELVSFTAKPQGRGIRLDWVTNGERNAGQYHVERSRDLTDFTPIASLPAGGTTDQRQTYGFPDEWPLEGTNYYRLRQVDVDGRSAYSKIAAATATDSEPILDVLGNPTDKSAIRVYTRNLPDSIFQLLTSTGQVYSLNTAIDGDGTLRLTTPASLLPGMYWLRADTAGHRISRVVVIR
ncbi:T9SS type A sorting domain-containing protein [Spirosoma rhododendri]|uniref:T9SS type A sorting domain-containing protein n=1 Tax=Spirosoma rhododendri TaxID=2728024 RepID=A0A7L5DJF1_9BACT|nr:T9SS type A sorting domain-containing protein [Spirosoma rhododendri]QJD78564.1 T9SS type A sorting domain-containing protein [Spirosoma rhododendri]